ncbi:MAG: ABC transporter substrate-binding protein [Deltaproteobacteria bacterium]
MAGSMRPIFVALLLALMGPYALAEQYCIGLALPDGTHGRGPESRAIVRVMRIYENQLAGPLGSRLAEEFGFRPPSIKFKVRFEPTHDKDYTRKVAKEFVQSPCVAVIGHWDSGTALAARPVYEKSDMALIAPVATNPVVTHGSKTVFTMMYNDDWQGAVIAAYVTKVLKKEAVAVGYADDVYGRGLLKSFMKQAESMGSPPVATIPLEPRSDAAKPSHHEGWTAACENADAVVLFTNEKTGIEVFRELRKHGIQVPVIGADAFKSLSLIRDVDKVAKELSLAQPNLVIASPFFYELAPLPAYHVRRLYQQAVRKEMAQRQNLQGPLNEDPPPYAGLFLDAAFLITRGIMVGQKAGLSSVPEMREAVLNYLRSLDTPEDAVDGFSGKLYFNRNGNIPRPVLFAWVEKDALRPAFTQLTSAKESWRDRAATSRGERRPIWEVAGKPMVETHVVLTGINLFRIDNIDLRNQTFDAEFFLWFKWERPENLELNQNTIFFWNGIYSVNDQLVELAEDLNSDPKYRAVRVKGSFLDEYDLHNYPFDVQTLHIAFSLQKYGTDRVKLAMDEDVFAAEDRFTIFPREYERAGGVEHMSGTRRLQSTLGDARRDSVGGRGIDFSVYQVKLTVRRNPFPYLLQLLLPLFVLSAISLSVYWVPVRHFGVRVTLVLTALLSVLVFHMSKADALPNVGYMTLADKYFVFAYLIMTVSILANIWIEWVRTKRSMAKAEIINSGCRYIVTAAAVFLFLELSVPAIERWYFRAIVGLGFVFAIWLVSEFVRNVPGVQAKLNKSLLSRSHSDSSHTKEATHGGS